MIEIKNLRFSKPEKEYDVRVDRASIVGNPYFMKDESMRDEVCDKYEKYFMHNIVNNKDFREFVLNLVSIYEKYGKLNLYCWCAPKRCHAETIKNYIERLVG